MTEDNTTNDNDDEEEIVTPIMNLSEDIGYDGASKRFFGRPIPEERRCTALKKNCPCGYHYKKSDLFDKKGDRFPPPHYCPQCGRERQRCANPKEYGLNVCRFHGGAAVKAKLKKNFSYVPSRLHLEDDDVATLEKMLKEDDDSLKEEFHILRILFGKALRQFNDTYQIQIREGYGDVIREGDRLANMLSKLSKIVTDRKKADQFISSSGEQLQKVEFEDPRVKYLIKEMIRESEINTITKILTLVLKSLDPKGNKGIAYKLPESLIPYMSKKYMTREEDKKSKAGEKDVEDDDENDGREQRS